MMPITVTKVSDAQRLNFLPSMFGSTMMRAEALLFNYAEQLAPDSYRGGYWDYYKTSNDTGYAAPSTPERYKLAVQGNGFEGEMSNDAAGIVFTLYVFNQLCHQTHARGLHELSEELADRYYALREYAMQHAERGLILHAID
ncbi:antirestriction protein [Caballeronia zhejiangensis]|uniref:antirestriction protein n=1 Tax=Caballeronia zhejiangensis TaxID=871203 RepID=UPI001F51F2C2|nr:antirestriction protein [Caballeronia zhejiangensis]MCI1046931.1 antirestriction protein [Caballeronia zhejiangensis]